MADDAGMPGRRTALALAIVLVAPLVCIPGWIALHPDLPSPDDADLMRRVAVLEEHDGYAAFREAAAKVEFPSEGYDRLVAHLRCEALEPDWVEERVRANGEAFAELKRGLEAPALQIPVFDLPGDDLVDVLPKIQTLVRLSAAEARLLDARGDRSGAIERALLGLRVGRKLSEAAEPGLIAMMTGVASQTIGLQALEHLLRDAPLSARAGRELWAWLDASRWEPEAWQGAWASEYRFFRAVLEEAIEEHGDGSMGWEEVATLGAEGGGPQSLIELLPSRYTFQPNRTLRGLAAIYRELGHRGGLDCQAARERAMPALPLRGDEPPLSPARKLGLLLGPNSVGRIVIAIAVPNLVAFDLKRCHIETRIGLVQAMAALLAHERETGALPERLDDLVPEYLPAVPEDRFDGRPLRYAKARRVVWSVGGDFTDDGPPDSPSQAEASEPAISLAR